MCATHWKIFPHHHIRYKQNNQQTNIPGLTTTTTTMSPKLKPLLLPQLVEERRKRESRLDTELDLASASFSTQNSSASELPSPVTPTFSTRGHFRYPSSTSSIDSTYHNTLCDSPSSPTFNTKSGKRSLPDVQEEPQREKEESFDMLDDRDDLYDCLCMSIDARFPFPCTNNSQAMVTAVYTATQTQSRAPSSCRPCQLLITT